MCLRFRATHTQREESLHFGKEEEAADRARTGISERIQDKHADKKRKRDC